MIKAKNLQEKYYYTWCTYDKITIKSLYFCCYAIRFNIRSMKRYSYFALLVRPLRVEWSVLFFLWGIRTVQYSIVVVHRYVLNYVTIKKSRDLWTIIDGLFSEWHNDVF